MHKTIYICLMTLFFSIPTFADGPFDEYGINNSSYGSPLYNTGSMMGGTYWSAMSSAFYSQMNPVTPYSYLQTMETKVKTSESYIVSDTKPADSPNTIVVQYVSPSTGWDMYKIYPATTITSTQEKTVSTSEANLSVLATYGPNTLYNFNVYEVANQTYTYNTYKATTNGPILVSSAVQPAPPPPVVPYSFIPRNENSSVAFDPAPGSDFQIAVQLYSKETLTLSEASKVITDYIDKVIPDAINGRILFMTNTINKVMNGLPPDQKGQAADLLKEYMSSDTVDDDTTLQNPILDKTDYTFDEKGVLKSTAAGTGVVKITTKDGLKSPSQLDIRKLEHRKAMSKVAVFLAKKLKAPVGTIFSSGVSSTDPNSIAYTEGRSPYTIRFNYKSGAFSKDLDNICNFTSVIKHELLHRANFTASPQIRSTLSSHIDVYLNQITHISFAKTTDDNGNDFKLSIIRSMAIYILNMDKKKNTENNFIYAKSKIKEKIDTFNSLNLHYKLVYPVPDWTQGSLTISIKDTNTLNTPEDANKSYYTINEE